MRKNDPLQRVTADPWPRMSADEPTVSPLLGKSMGRFFPREG